MIYLSFIFWLFLTIFAGMGVYELWARLIKPSWLNWALLPGTVVSEMAFIFGTLVTGGEVRSKILPSKGKGGDGGAQPTTQASHPSGFFGPMIASMIAIVGCGLALYATHRELGGAVMSHFASSLPQSLPNSWDSLWEQAGDQLKLLRRMFETLGDVPWSNWRVPLFVYLGATLAVRLVPARRPLKPTLAGAAVISALVALAVAVSRRFENLMADIWPLVSYVWTTLLALLVITLLVSGIVYLAKALAGKSKT